MIYSQLTSILRPVAIAAGALSLAACGLLDNLSEPTHRYTIVAQGSAAASDEVDREALAESVEVIRQRIENSGGILHNHGIARGDTIMLETSGIESEQLLAVISSKGEAKFLKVDDRALPQNTMQGFANPGSKILPTADPYLPDLAVKRLGGIDGRHIERATPTFNSFTNEPVVDIQFNEQGAQQFAQYTRDNVGKQFAIVVDDVILTAPFINEPIVGGRAQISGNFTRDGTITLAIILNSGELPVTFVLSEVAAIE